MAQQQINPFYIASQEDEEEEQDYYDDEDDDYNNNNNNASEQYPNQNLYWQNDDEDLDVEMLLDHRGLSQDRYYYNNNKQRRQQLHHSQQQQFPLPHLVYSSQPRKLRYYFTMMMIILIFLVLILLPWESKEETNAADSKNTLPPETDPQLPSNKNVNVSLDTLNHLKSGFAQSANAMKNTDQDGKTGSKSDKEANNIITNNNSTTTATNSTNMTFVSHAEEAAQEEAAQETEAPPPEEEEEEEDSVSCGGEHSAPTCADCPQGNGATWCKGDCIWIDDECTLNEGGIVVVVDEGETTELKEATTTKGGADWETTGEVVVVGEPETTTTILENNNDGETNELAKEEEEIIIKEDENNNEGSSQQTTTIKSANYAVSCGNRWAPTCGACVQGEGLAGQQCQGDCAWIDYKCVKNSKDGEGELSAEKEGGESLLSSPSKGTFEIISVAGEQQQQQQQVQAEAKANAGEEEGVGESSGVVEPAPAAGESYREKEFGVVKPPAAGADNNAAAQTARPKQKQRGVSCGETLHRAPFCGACTQGKGEIWCHGDCTWVDRKCILLSEAEDNNG